MFLSTSQGDVSLRLGFGFAAHKKRDSRCHALYEEALMHIEITTKNIKKTVNAWMKGWNAGRYAQPTTPWLGLNAISPSHKTARFIHFENTQAWTCWFKRITPLLCKKHLKRRVAVDSDKWDGGRWKMPNRPLLPPIASTGSTEPIWLAAERGLAHPVMLKSRESDHSVWLTPAKINPAVVRTRPGKLKILEMAWGGGVHKTHTFCIKHS